MSGGIYPKAKALVPGILRSLSSVVLILIAAGCVYLSFAVMEAPRDTWWKFWTIYTVVGLSCLLGAGWLLRRSLTSIVLSLSAAVCVYLSIAVLDAPREDWWTYWTIRAVVWTICAVAGLSCMLGVGWLLRARRAGA
jgi:hypothetical protein